jgi:hypothetical protein
MEGSDPLQAWLEFDPALDAGFLSGLSGLIW